MTRQYNIFLPMCQAIINKKKEIYYEHINESWNRTKKRR